MTIEELTHRSATGRVYDPAQCERGCGQNDEGSELEVQPEGIRAELIGPRDEKAGDGSMGNDDGGLGLRGV